MTSFDPVSSVIMGTMGIISGIGQAHYQKQAAKEELESIDLEQKQSEIQYQQKMMNNYDTLQKVLAAQTAQASVRGVSLGSASLGAIQRNTVNVSSREAKNIETEKSISDLNSDIERQKVKTTLHAQLFGDVMQAGFSIADLAMGAI